MNIEVQQHPNHGAVDPLYHTPPAFVAFLRRLGRGIYLHSDSVSRLKGRVAGPRASHRWRSLHFFLPPPKKAIGSYSAIHPSKARSVTKIRKSVVGALSATRYPSRRNTS